mmetsp:Transcript_5446/g.10025  ORF Transcript_5446/g.10025 Transcript_5446/m.10025 type:complete len:157 (-) Transcript_5446:48-518(-)
MSKWMKVLCEDLHLNSGITLDNGNSDCGGDVEVFVVRGSHKTPWHFDGQHNFTIQLKGHKKWTVAKSYIENPITNMHPMSTNTKTLKTNTSVHDCYACEYDQSLSGPTHDDKYTFVLRSGSVAYVPAGYWHQVESLDPEGESVSINFSVDSGRWVS